MTFKPTFPLPEAVKHLNYSLRQRGIVPLLWALALVFSLSFGAPAYAEVSIGQNLPPELQELNTRYEAFMLTNGDILASFSQTEIDQLSIIREDVDGMRIASKWLADAEYQAEKNAIETAYLKLSEFSKEENKALVRRFDTWFADSDGDILASFSQLEIDRLSFLRFDAYSFHLASYQELYIAK